MILSICIPTYRREHYIDLLLSEIASSVRGGGLEELIEVVVLDNCSPDKTWGVLTRHADASPFIRPIRNKINIGAEANVIKSLYEANGAYTWLLSDHQKIMPGKLIELVSSLQAGGPDFCCVPVKQWTSPLSISGKVFELSDLPSPELGALLFTWGNISSLIGRTEHFMANLRSSVMIACYNYPHLSFIQGLSRTTRVMQIDSAIEFRLLGPGMFVKNYAPYRPCFINNILIVRRLAKGAGIYFSVSDFQTGDYRKAFAVESVRILLDVKSSFRDKIFLINGAFWANVGGFVPNKVFIISVSSFMLMLIPHFFRRLLLIRIMSMITPGSGLLAEIKNTK